MDLKEIMAQKRFVVVGDTLNEEKYAHKIKAGLLSAGYDVQCVGKELASFRDVQGEIDIIDLCINPVRGLSLLKEYTPPCKCVVLQPGAESDEIKDFLLSSKIDFVEGCLLVGLSVYGKKKTES